MIYQFSDCALDLERRTLLRNAVEQHIEPQVFDVLVLLVRAAGRIVTKDELVEKIWNGRAISDDAITSRIKAARKAIGDDGRSQRLIRTMPRVGYRFDGEILADLDQHLLEADGPGDVERAGNPEIGYVTDRKGRSIGYAVHGEGPLVVVPPFWVTSADLWHDHPDIRDFYVTLGRGVRILRFDRPGSGLSRDAFPNETLDDEVALLEDFVAAMEVERFSLFAISAAGPVAIRYGVAHPKHVKRMCFYGSYADGRTLATPETQDMLVALIRQHWGVGSRALADIFVPSSDAEGRHRFAAQQRAAASPDQAAAMLRLSWNINATKQARDIRVPTLVLHRQDDHAVPVDNGQWLARNIPGARLQILPGDAHAPWFGSSDIASCANEFLKG
ncbi:MAG: alpha/beta fold hydrolase [Pseudomonadota bacterium]